MLKISRGGEIFADGSVLSGGVFREEANFFTDEGFGNACFNP